MSILKKQQPPEEEGHNSHENICNYIAELCENILEDPRGALISTLVDDREEGDDDDEEDDKSNKQNSGATVPAGKKRSQLRRLLDLATEENNSSTITTTTINNEHTRRLAMISLVAVFQDILPSYRIRLPTAAETAVRVNRETKLLWQYERSMLIHYQWFVKLLDQCWETEKKKKKKNRGMKNVANGGGGVSVVGVTAICALTELLKHGPTFNFSSMILSIVVRGMVYNGSDHVRDTCRQAIIYVFRNDSQGEVSLEASKLIARQIHNYKGNNMSGGYSDMLRTLVTIPLRVHQDEAEAAKIHEAAAKKSKKKRLKKQQQENDDMAAADDLREREDIEKELKEGSATVDATLLAKSQADTLQTVIVCYFRILKQSSSSNNHNNNHNGNGKGGGGGRLRQLLPAALEGLARFAHLIHLETVVDLLALLKNILNPTSLSFHDHNDDNNHHELPLDAALNSILTAIQTLQGPGGQTLPIDMKEYISPLYRQLLRLVTDDPSSLSSSSSSSNNNNNNTSLALTAVNLSFFKRREFSKDRVAAFFKRLLDISLHLPPIQSAPTLSVSHKLLSSYHTHIQPLLESEIDGVIAGSGSGSTGAGISIFHAYDPERSNPYASSAWQLSLLQFHIHPTISKLTRNILHDHTTNNYNNNHHEQIATLMERNHHQLYIEIDGQRMKKKLWKHPLRATTASSDTTTTSKRKQRNTHRIQYRFITPRPESIKTESQLIQELMMR